MFKKCNSVTVKLWSLCINTSNCRQCAMAERCVRLCGNNHRSRNASFTHR